MISKELLNEVLGDTPNQWNWRYFEGYKNLECTEATCSGRGENTTGYMSIYEFAHKCKEWALSKDFEIESSLFIDANKKKIGYSQVLREEAPMCQRTADTEIESIFLVCEWIRTNNVLH